MKISTATSVVFYLFLGEILSCLEENGDEIDLNDLVVTLDIICLNLSYDTESGFLQRSNRMRHTTSFCSTSSPQEPMEPVYDMDDSMAASGYDIIFLRQGSN